MTTKMFTSPFNRSTSSEQFAPTVRRYSTPLFFGFVLLLYITTMQTSFFWGDPLDEVRAATASERFVPPQHLISSSVNAGILTVTAASSEPTSFILLQVVMILATLFGTFGLYLLLKRFNVEELIIFGALGLYVFANGIWYHATTVETGAIPLSLLVWSLYWLLGNNLPTRNDLMISFALLSFSVLFNLQQALFIPLFFLYTLFQLRKSSEKLSTLISIAGTVLLTGVLPYMLIAHFTHHFSSIHDFISWLTYNPNAEMIGRMKEVSLESATRSIAGIFALMVEPAGGTSWLKLLMRGNENVGIEPTMILRLIVPGLLLVVIGVGWLRSFTLHRQVALLTLFSLIGGFLFGLVWLGSDLQFWLPIWPFLLLSASVGFSAIVQKKKNSSTVIALGVSVISLLLLMLNIPRTSPSLLFRDGGAEFQSVQTFSGVVERGDLVIAPGGRWGTYFAKMRPEVEFINLELDTNGAMGTEGKIFINVLRKRIEPIVEQGNKVFIDGGFETREVILSSPWDGFRLKHDLSREELFEGLQKFYRFTPLEEGARNGVALLSQK